MISPLIMRQKTQSDIAFSPQQDLLVAASWDKKVPIYEIDPNTGNNQGRAMFEHEAPVLVPDGLFRGTKVISGGADKQVELFDIASQRTNR